MLQQHIIPFTLYYLSNGRLPEVKNKRKFIHSFIYLLFIYLFIYYNPWFKGQRIICKGVLNPIYKQITYELI